MEDTITQFKSKRGRHLLVLVKTLCILLKDYSVMMTVIISGTLSFVVGLWTYTIYEQLSNALEWFNILTLTLSGQKSLETYFVHHVQVVSLMVSSLPVLAFLVFANFILFFWSNPDHMRVLKSWIPRFIVKSASYYAGVLRASGGFAIITIVILMVWLYALWWFYQHANSSFIFLQPLLVIVNYKIFAGLMHNYMVEVKSWCKTSKAIILHIMNAEYQNHHCNLAYTRLEVLATKFGLNRNIAFTRFYYDHVVNNGESLLHITHSKPFQLDKVKICLDIGEHPNTKDMSGAIALHYLRPTISKAKFLHAVSLEIAAGLDLRNEILTNQNKDLKEVIVAVFREFVTLTPQKFVVHLMLLDILRLSGLSIEELLNSNLYTAGDDVHLFISLMEKQQPLSLQLQAANVIRRNLRPNALIGVKKLKYSFSNGSCFQLPALHQSLIVLEDYAVLNDNIYN